MRDQHSAGVNKGNQALHLVPVPDTENPPSFNLRYGWQQLPWLCRVYDKATGDLIKRVFAWDSALGVVGRYETDGDGHAFVNQVTGDVSIVQEQRQIRLQPFVSRC
jgi:hypothetical protein